MNENIKDIAAALSKAQLEMKPAARSKKAYNYMYADLEDIWDAIRVPLTNNGLSITHVSKGIDIEKNVIEIETWLLHTSGQAFSTSIALPITKMDPQSVGSLITYARRYGIACITGVVTEDDDAQTVQPGSQALSQPAYSAPASSDPNHKEDKKITTLQKKMLLDLVEKTKRPLKSAADAMTYQEAQKAINYYSELLKSKPTNQES